MEAGLWQAVLFFLFIVLSAFFSGSESALFSLSDSDLHKIRENQEKRKSYARVAKLLNRPGKLLNAILIGNTIVNVAAATVAALFTSRMFQGQETLIFLGEVVLVTLILLIFSEVSPKVLAVRHSLSFSLAVSFPLSLVVGLLTPLALVMNRVTRGVALILRLRQDREFIREEEFKILFEVGEAGGALQPSEREMIHSIFEFRDTTVKEVMIPRMDMQAVEKEIPVQELFTIIKSQGHSRIPVYNENVDDIIGILHVKDLLQINAPEKAFPPLANLVREAYFVPEGKLIDELLRDFQRQRIHMAIVVDEYGGTAGLVTLEDIIEEIVGEIMDEYDVEPPLYRKIGENRWLVDGKISIEDLNEELDLSVPEEEEFESLAGFILQLLGHIPEPPEEVRYGNLLLKVENVEGRRIQKVIIQLLEQEQESDLNEGK